MAGHSIDTGTPQLLADFADGVMTLTLNRPDARNALTEEMLDGLADQIATSETNKDVRCLVLTGAGKGFCAGGDVKLMLDPSSGAQPGADPHSHVHRQRQLQRATAGKLFTMAKPTLAVVNGAAAGAGLALALACDLRVMSSTAVMTTAFAQVGLPGDFGGTFFMTQLIGAARSRELYLLSEVISAERAVALGLSHRSVDPNSLAEEALTLAQRLAVGPTITLGYMKENLNRALSGTMEECLDMEASHHVGCMATADHREAARAFFEKRAPKFIGA